MVCRECRTVETIPLFEGPAELEATDPLLDNVVRRHVQKHGDSKPDAAVLIRISEDLCNCRSCRGQRTQWEGHRDEILNNMRERWTGFEPSLYEVKNTFEEDAMACFRRHGRPEVDCYDWREDHRLLTPASWHSRSDELVDRSDRKKILSTLAPYRRPIYLCDFCPVAAYYTTRVRLAAGAYDKQPGED